MQPIGASEMIINERGAIYHLNVRPDQIADTIITVGDPDRVAEVSKYFDRVEHVCAHREFITHTGYVGNNGGAGGGGTSRRFGAGLGLHSLVDQVKTCAHFQV